MYGKINVAVFPILLYITVVTILLNNSALNTSLTKVSLQVLFPKTFVRPVNP